MNEAKTRWHSVPFVWLLIALPLTAVVAGFTTLWLAIRSDDGLVADDYYKRGKEINRVLARDEAALRHGLRADLNLDIGHDLVRVKLTSSASYPLPNELELKVLHATRAGLDRSVMLLRTADGGYQGALSLPDAGRWHVQVAAGDWRLVSQLSIPDETRTHLAPTEAP